MQGTVAVHAHLRHGEEDRSTRAEGEIALSLAHASHAHGRRLVVAGSGNHLHAGGEVEICGRLGREGAHDPGTLVDVRQLGLGQAALGEHLSRPTSVGDVEQQRAARVGDVSAEHARETPRQVVLWQHDAGDARIGLRLVLAHPDDLGRRESRERDVAAAPRELLGADAFVELVAHGLAAPVVPEDGVANRLPPLVERHQPVHLAAKGDACDAIGRDAQRV